LWGLVATAIETCLIIWQAVSATALKRFLADPSENVAAFLIFCWKVSFQRLPNRETTAVPTSPSVRFGTRPCHGRVPNPQSHELWSAGIRQVLYGHYTEVRHRPFVALRAFLDLDVRCVFTVDLGLLLHLGLLAGRDH